MVTTTQFFGQIGVQTPDNWAALAASATQVIAYHDKNAQELTLVSLQAKKKLITDPLRWQRNLYKALKARRRASGFAQQIYYGATAAALEGRAAAFGPEALPQRLEEAAVTGRVLQHFVRAGQAMAARHKFDGLAPVVAERLDRVADRHLQAAQRRLTEGEVKEKLCLPLRPRTVLEIVTRDVSGLSGGDTTRLRQALTQFNS